MKRPKRTEITGLQADLILWAFDDYYKTNEQGKVTYVPLHPGYTLHQLQKLRDRLFAIHEHPWEEEDGDGV
jgi:hypothetical protein